MNLHVWQELVANHRETSELISAVAPEAAASDLDGLRPLLANHEMETLHGQLRQALARASAKLGTLLDGNELKQILFLLSIAIDEKVQRRLAPEEAPKWPLLQRALFDVHDGGDLFYDMVDDLFPRSDTPELVFEVCCFCLSDGFIGRFARNRQVLEDYKQKVGSRITRSMGSSTASGYFTSAYQASSDPGVRRRDYLYSAAALVVVLLLIPVLLLVVW
jgi:type IV/VI secretion system ImpK/VasF family protein